MHGLPEDFDGRFFVGKDLVQVSFSANTISFSFDDGQMLIFVDESDRYESYHVQNGGEETHV